MRNGPHPGAVGSWPALLVRARACRQPLLLMLAGKAQADGYSLVALAQVLGVSRFYLYGLYSGQCEMANIGEEFIDAAARYLGQATIVVRSAAGEFVLGDFFTQDGLADALSMTQQYLPKLSELLVQERPIVQVFAATMVGLNVVSRQGLRNLMAEGPGWMRMRAN
ncbi:MAG: hypothetical protein ABI476_05230 [Oxalobacteraceae bacterium]